MPTGIIANWNWIRIVRLLIGVAAIAQGVLQKEFMLVAAGVFVAAMAVLNTGCCGSASCPVTPQTKTKNKDDVYEELGV